MPAEITHHLAAAGRMADVNCILQVEMVGDGFEIVGIVVHVVAVAGLSRTAVAAPINSDDPITLGEKEQHLRAPVFVIDFDVGPVFFPNSYVRHDVVSFLSWLFVRRYLTQTTRDNQRFAGD